MKKKSREKVAVITVGGCGMNSLEALTKSSDLNVKFIAVNRDKDSLNHCMIKHKVHLDADKNSAECVVMAVRCNESKIGKKLSNINKAIIVAGMGGFTGSYASPEIAKIAEDMGCSIWSIVIEPFEFEGTQRAQNAREGITLLEKNSNAVLRISNQRLIKEVPSKTSMKKAFRVMDGEVVSLVKKIVRENI